LAAQIVDARIDGPPVTVVQKAYPSAMSIPATFPSRDAQEAAITAAGRRIPQADRRIAEADELTATAAMAAVGSAPSRPLASSAARTRQHSRPAIAPAGACLRRL